MSVGNFKVAVTLISINYKIIMQNVATLCQSLIVEWKLNTLFVFVLDIPPRTSYSTLPVTLKNKRGAAVKHAPQPNLILFDKNMTYSLLSCIRFEYEGWNAHGDRLGQS